MENKFQEKFQEHEQDQEQIEQGVEEEGSSEEGIFPGGPTQSQVDEWKSKFKDGIFMTEVGQDVFVWRPITRLEYKNIMKIKGADAMFREEKICETCILWPTDYSFTQMKTGKAGVPSILVDQIMEKSGFLAEGEAQQL